MPYRLRQLILSGARPNYLKIAPLIKAIDWYNADQKINKPDITPLLVHTGQHYDRETSKVFFEELKIPKPDINLDIGSYLKLKFVVKWGVSILLPKKNILSVI